MMVTDVIGMISGGLLALFCGLRFRNVDAREEEITALLGTPQAQNREIGGCVYNGIVSFLG